MKIRTDFVTNSSSSSFILARKGELTDKQKEIIVQFVEEKFFGKKILTPENTEEEIQNVCEEEYFGEEMQEKISLALKEGKDIYTGWIDFECCEDAYAYIFKQLWKRLEKSSEETFETIDGDLYY